MLSLPVWFLPRSILLFLDHKPEGKKESILTDTEIAKRCQCETKLVYTVSKQYAENGLDRVLTRKKRETPPVPAKVTGEVEAKIIAMACGQPPEGYSRWTLRLYEEHSKKVVGIQLSDTTIREVLKKLR
jgi:transposase